MSKEKFHRYRFYEILQSHIKGGDLSKFTPKNTVESKLINDLTIIASGGSSGESSEVPVYKYNNPDLKGLYYGLIPANGFTKFVFDFRKFAEAFAEYGVSSKPYSLDSWPMPPYKKDHIEMQIMDVSTNGVGGGCFGVRFKIYQDRLEAYNYGTGETYLTINYSDLGFDEKYPEFIQEYGDPTIGMIFNEIGRVEFDLTEMGLIYLSCIITYIYVPNLAGPCNEVDLNEHPIDYMWFE